MVKRCEWKRDELKGNEYCSNEWIFENQETIVRIVSPWNGIKKMMARGERRERESEGERKRERRATCPRTVSAQAWPERSSKSKKGKALREEKVIKSSFAEQKQVFRFSIIISSLIAVCKCFCKENISFDHHLFALQIAPLIYVLLPLHRKQDERRSASAFYWLSSLEQDGQHWNPLSLEEISICFTLKLL